ncbi:MAG: hypothetical protein DRJ50_03775 [Actinobacteria bacterium]|nr:MAG: hypothetical protein DRJ50_03775 [Actinomycetota bacterium]
MTQAGENVEECTGAILFTDLVGFTAYTSSLGDLEALRVLDRQREIVDGALGDAGDARVVKELGDGLMIWIGSAAEGLRCAMELMLAIENERTAGEFPLAVRMGMHYGSALVRGDDLVGQSINIASRVADLAGPGELLVSGDLIGEFSGQLIDFEMHSVGPVRVKGVIDPIWINRLSA